MDRIGVEGERTDLTLRRWLAVGVFVLLVLQVAAADVVFVWYGDTNGWDISTTAISAWLGATVVQVVSVALVLMNYVFYREDS